MTRRVYRYSRAVIAKAYAASAIGLGVTLLPLALLEPISPLSAVLLVVAGLFLVYLAKAVALHAGRLAVDDDGIRIEGPFGARIDWDDLRAMQLNYYTTRNDRSQGWFQLVVKGSSGTVRIESSLEGFTQIAARAAAQALRRGHRLGERTRTHLAILGVELPPEPAYSLDAWPGAHHA